MQGLAFHSPVYNTLYHVCVQVCSYVMDLIQVQQGVSEASPIILLLCNIGKCMN